MCAGILCGCCWCLDVVDVCYESLPGGCSGSFPLRLHIKWDSWKWVIISPKAWQCAMTASWQVQNRMFKFFFWRKLWTPYVVILFRKNVKDQRQKYLLNVSESLKFVAVCALIAWKMSTKVYENVTIWVCNARMSTITRAEFRDTRIPTVPKVYFAANALFYFTLTYYLIASFYTIYTNNT